MKHLKLELRHWTQADAMELTSLCNAVDRRFLSDRLPNPYTEKDAEEWLKTVSENEAVTGIYRAVVYDRKLIGSMMTGTWYVTYIFFHHPSNIFHQTSDVTHPSL